MATVIEKIGSFVKINTTGREPNYYSKTEVKIQYNNNNNTVLIQTPDFYVSEFGTDVTIMAVIINNEATLDAQLILLFPNEGGGSSTPNVANYTTFEGETSFLIPALVGSTLLIATRSGAVKSITNSATSDTQFLQVNAGTITAPTGDVFLIEQFTFLYI